VRGQRSHALPDLPTVAEFVPGYESSGYFGFGAPANTPAQIVDKLNKEINAGLADPKAEGSARRSRWYGARRLVDGLWKADHRGNREMGQGDPGRQEQAE
jgi:Tripartite tricarboxylate transporter family receptor